jgi:hypothetical protein
MCEPRPFGGSRGSCVEQCWLGTGLTETDRHDQNEPSVQEPQQVQQDDDHDRNTCQPKYDVAEHNLPRLRDRSTGGWSKRKARGYALIAVVATLLGRPPGGSK